MGAVEPLWPIADQGSLQGDLSPENWVQPTVSGRTESALFGCVRNGGKRFHEGIDIAPKAQRTRSGEATDPIIAVMAGRVIGINPVAGNSSYGCFVVLEHERLDVPIYTLYAHLASVVEGLAEGDWVKRGATLGVMGRSASYSIPKDRAHLHFEVGLIKSLKFDQWYRAQDRYGSANRFGVANGINLVGFDPLAFFEAAKAGQVPSMAAYLRGFRPAFGLRVATAEVPNFIRRYPSLKTMAPPPGARVVAWDVDFTWYGLPFQWTPRSAEEVPPAHSGDVTLLYADKSAFAGDCRHTLLFHRDGSVELGSTLRNDLRIIFGFR